MKYLWDTDTCVHFLNGNKDVARKVKSIGAENISTTIISIIELKYGAYKSARVESNLDRIHRLESNLAVLDNLNNEVGIFFAKTKAQLRKKGITISDFDLLIASVASSLN